MTDDRKGFSSDDLIRQAREKFEKPETDSISEDMTREATRDADEPTPTPSAPTPQAPTEPVPPWQTSPAAAAPPPGAPTPAEAAPGSPRAQDAVIGGFTIDELRDLAASDSAPEYRSTDRSGRLPPGPVDRTGDLTSSDELLLGPGIEPEPQVGNRNSRWLLIVAAILGGFFLVGILGNSGTSATALEQGDCLQEPDGDEFTSVDVVECSEAHDYEVFAVSTLPGSDYPGDFEILDDALTSCEPLFESYVGRDYGTSKWYIDVFVPGQELWDDGNRAVRCLLYVPDSSFEDIIQFSGSARGRGE